MRGIGAALAAMFVTIAPAWAQDASTAPARAGDAYVQADEEVAPGAEILEAQGEEVRAETAVPTTETDCADGVDNDRDTLPDCGDADCRSQDVCQPDGGPEASDARCRDFVDNDRDGHIDCDDDDCNADHIAACRGSWSDAPPAAAGAAQATTPTSAFLPDLGEGLTVEDFIGRMGDQDGERNDHLCSDGLDNDGDGAVDCADYGCRFDTQVTVCQSARGMRFSIVAGLSTGVEQTTEYEIDEETNEVQEIGPDPVQRIPTTDFDLLQVRALGPIPLIQDSFFLISARAEKDFRVTFAMFQIPVLGGRQRLNINSGGGGLSQAAVISASKQLLLSQPYYLYNAFDQGNGAAIELSGPLIPRLNYRVYAAGGTGRWGGAIGGQYVGEGFNNYTWSSGGQLGLNVIGTYSRFDSPFLYVPVPTSLGFAVGAKYDQRNDEHFAAVNVASTLRWRRLIVSAETYGKHELSYDFDGLAYNVTAGFLVWPKKIMVAADFGEYMLMGLTSDVLSAAAAADSADDGSDDTSSDYDVRRERSERQWRAAVHYYFYRNIGLLSLVYTDNTRQTRVAEERYLHTQDLTLSAQYRF